jgi:hypothetical protein
MYYARTRINPPPKIYLAKFSFSLLNASHINPIYDVSLMAAQGATTIERHT